MVPETIPQPVYTSCGSCGGTGEAFDGFHTWLGYPCLACGGEGGTYEPYETTCQRCGGTTLTRTEAGRTATIACADEACGWSRTEPVPQTLELHEHIITVTHWSEESVGIGVEQIPLMSNEYYNPAGKFSVFDFTFSDSEAIKVAAMLLPDGLVVANAENVLTDEQVMAWQRRKPGVPPAVDAVDTPGGAG